MKTLKQFFFPALLMAAFTPIAPAQENSPASSFLRSKYGQETAERIEAYFKSQNVPIAFYGKVVDTMGMPLPGVRVDYRLNSPEFSEKSAFGFDNHPIADFVVTSPDGTFAIEGKTGSSIDFTLMEKEGFCQVRESLDRVDYADTHIPKPTPDRAAPVIFILHPNRPADDAITWEGAVKGLWGSDPVRIDLTTGKASPDGALIITSHRNASEDSAPRVNFNDIKWNITFAIDGGEIQEVKCPNREVFAPEQGYFPKVEMTEDRTVIWAHGHSDTVLYFRKDDQYGMIRFKLYPEREPDGTLILQTVFNTTHGGRNVTPAPEWQTLMQRYASERPGWDSDIDSKNERLLKIEQSREWVGMSVEQMKKILDFKDPGWIEAGPISQRWVKTNGKGYQWICEFDAKGAKDLRKLKIE